jgi:hypothetical protein
VFSRTRTYPIEQSGYSPELQKLVRLETLGELDGVVLVKRLQTTSERDVVLLFNEQVVVGLIDDGDVELLGTDEVWLDKRQMILRLQDLDDSAMIQTWGKGGQEIREEFGLDESQLGGSQPKRL